MIETHLIPATTHGRVLVQDTARARGVLVGFHGYMENAGIQMSRLTAIPGVRAWRLVTVQGLHRFYKGRGETVVASWMVREDREAMIADNVQYVDAALDTIAPGPGQRIVYAGFSQGVAMAFRAAIKGRRDAAGVIAVGGDVPPELWRGDARFPPVLLLRGSRDEWYTQQAFDADVAALTARGVPLEAHVYDGGHDWSHDVATLAGRFLDRC